MEKEGCGKEVKHKGETGGGRGKMGKGGEVKKPLRCLRQGLSNKQHNRGKETVGSLREKNQNKVRLLTMKGL